MSSVAKRIAALAALGLVRLLAPPVIDAQWSAGPGATVRNAFGPGGAMCRGACGGDCPDTCDVDHFLECVDDQSFLAVTAYDCGTHQGCREHDDCLDACAEWAPESTQGTNFYLGRCAASCHSEADRKYGTRSTSRWTFGHGPRPHQTRFEYSKPSPDAQQIIYRCPDGMRLECKGGRGRCVPAPEGPDEEEEPATDEPPTDEPQPQPIGVFIENRPICLRVGESETLRASVIGLRASGVRWSVLSGPGKIDRRSGELRTNGEGALLVHAESTTEPQWADQIEIAVGACDCSFSAMLSGDSNRGHVQGDIAIFSTRGQAGILGAGSTEAREDMLRIMEMTEGLQQMLGGGGSAERDARQQLMNRWKREIDEESRERGASSGGTFELRLEERARSTTGTPRERGATPNLMVDALAERRIEPGFTGEIPLSKLIVQTGDVAEDGTPIIFLLLGAGTGTSDAGTRARLVVTGYDGRLMEGTLSADLVGDATAMKIQPSPRPIRLRMSTDFVAGVFNPMRFELGCSGASPLGE